MRSFFALRFLLLIVLAVLAGAAAGTFGDGDKAEAVAATDSFTYSGSGQQTIPIFNTPIVSPLNLATAQTFLTTACVISLNPLSPPCVAEGLIAAHNALVPATQRILYGDLYVNAQADLVWTVEVVNATTEYSFNAPDGLIEGDTINVTSRNVSSAGPDKEFKFSGKLRLTLRTALDFGYNGASACGNRSLPLAATGLIGDDFCNEIVIETPSVPIIEEDMIAPYGGGTQSFHVLTPNIAPLSVPVCKYVLEAILTAVGVGPVLEAIPAELNLLDLCNIGPALNFDATLTGTAGFHASRDMLLGGAPAAGSQANITWPDAAPVAEGIRVPCDFSAGKTLRYRLQNSTYDSSLTQAGAGVSLALDFTGLLGLPVIGLPSGEIFGISNLVNFLQGNLPIPVASGASGFEKDLGEVSPDNKPPEVTLGPPAPASSNEGRQVQFTASAVDGCDTEEQLSFTWDFSDGGVGFGKTVFHTFTDNQTYSYRVTVCDRRANCTVADPNYVVSNANPTVDAGPAMQSDWGLPVSFHANGADAGVLDNTSLLYAWLTGDPADPAGHAGQDVQHTYSLPGGYTATAFVVDKDGGFSSDTVGVTITRRDTKLTFKGPFFSKPSKVVPLQATMVDEHGQPIPAGRVVFTLMDLAQTTVLQQVFADTDAFGLATASLALKQKPGWYAIRADFAGNALYGAGASGLWLFRVGNK